MDDITSSEIHAQNAKRPKKRMMLELQNIPVLKETLIQVAPMVQFVVAIKGFEGGPRISINRKVKWASDGEFHFMRGGFMLPVEAFTEQVLPAVIHILGLESKYNLQETTNNGSDNSTKEQGK